MYHISSGFCDPESHTETFYEETSAAGTAGTVSVSGSNLSGSASASSSTGSDTLSSSSASAKTAGSASSGSTSAGSTSAGSTSSAGAPTAVTGSSDRAAAASVSSSAYDQKVEAFLADSRFKNGASYGSSQIPYLSSALAYGCSAYANDFCWKVFGRANAQSGEAFSNINEIRDGDVLRLSNPHTVVVLYRNGSKLVTAEGNVNEKVLISETRWSIVNGQLYKNGSLSNMYLISGYHNQ